jgi:hypothetical protein
MGVKFIKLDPSSDSAIARLVETQGASDVLVREVRGAGGAESETRAPAEPVAEKGEGEPDVGQDAVASESQAEPAAEVEESHQVSPAASPTRRRTRGSDLIVIGLMVLVLLAAAVTLLVP